MVNRHWNNSPNEDDYIDSEGSISSSGVEQAHNGPTADSSSPDALSALKIAQQESRVVRYLRIVVVALLVTTATVISVATYKVTSQRQSYEFQTNFESDSNKVLDAVKYDIERTLTAVDSLVVAMISFARFANQSWPFVTIPNFELRVAKIRSLSKSVYLRTHVVVTAEQRLEWENFTQVHGGWFEESIRLQAKDPNFYGPILDEYERVDVIHDYNGEPVPYDRELYLPQWLESPSIPKYPPYNWDILDYQPNITTVYMLNNRKAMVTETYHLPDMNDPESVAYNDYDVDFFRDYVRPGQDPSEPIFDINYPMLDTVDEIVISDPKNERLAGFIAIAIYWRDLFERILPENHDGVVLVLDNPCTPSCTFQINGPDVEYLGQGDLHDRSYDKYMVRTNLLDFNSVHTVYAGVQIDRESCQHSFRVYASSRYRNQYVTNQPLILTILAALIFIFTSAVFVGYDWMVEYRQKLVMRSATKNSKIVSSLFPEKVRDRLLEEHDDESLGPARTKQLNGGMMNTYQINKFLQTGNLPSDEDKHRTRPIAELYPNTTIFFADIAGFTKWSSTRTPCHVFELLENIYSLFDGIAKRRKVFKVETIGDCYVAVTGIPNPQDDHAIIMVKFAHECIVKLTGTINKVAEQLGEDTRELGMRVGLHSGPTTAGVLRGERSRFQLFGDTVNTASRMESNGVKGCIHVSQTTADELSAKGKGAWLTPREEKLSVKGKGEMQTYFVTVSSGSRSGGTSRLLRSSTTGSTTERTDALDSDPMDREVADMCDDHNLSDTRSRLVSSEKDEASSALSTVDQLNCIEEKLHKRLMKNSGSIRECTE